MIFMQNQCNCSIVVCFDLKMGTWYTISLAKSFPIFTSFSVSNGIKKERAQKGEKYTKKESTSI